jgi:hypothetical protein
MPENTYYFAVEEFDKGSNVSPMSTPVSATTLARIPGKPGIQSRPVHRPWRSRLTR